MMNEKEYKYENYQKDLNECRDALDIELWRQTALRASGSFDHIPYDEGCLDLTRLAILVEEVGEVSQELQQFPVDNSRLREELIQVAAVAMSWAARL